MKIAVASQNRREITGHTGRGRNGFASNKRTDHNHTGTLRAEREFKLIN